MRVALFYLLLSLVVALAWWRGRSDERLAAATCMLGTLLTVAVGDPVHVRFATFDGLAFLVDLGVFFTFTAIALRSERFWPLWVAGLQLTATSVHLMIFLSPVVRGLVFGTASAFWSYPILLLIALGAWRTTIVERWRDDLDIARRGTVS